MEAAPQRLARACALSAVPDYCTLWRFAREKATDEFVAAALAETPRLQPLPLWQSHLTNRQPF